MADVTTEPEPLEAVEPLKLWAIECRVHFHVLAHSQREVSDRMDDLDRLTPLEFEGGNQPWIYSIHSCSVPDAAIEDISSIHADGGEALEDIMPTAIEEHARSCKVCRTQDAGNKSVPDEEWCPGGRVCRCDPWHENRRKRDRV